MTFHHMCVYYGVSYKNTSKTECTRNNSIENRLVIDIVVYYHFSRVALYCLYIWERKLKRNKFFIQL